MTKKTVNRSPWSLNDLFSGIDSPDITAAFEKAEQDATAIEAYREQLTPEITEETFLALIKALEAGAVNVNHLFAFAYLSFAQDTQNQDFQVFLARIQQFGAELQNRTLFFSLWWKALDDENAARLIANAGDYTYWLQEMRNLKPFTLTEKEEKLINIKDLTGSSALNTLYDSITNRYVFKLTVDGEEKELTRGGLMAQVYSTDPDMRAAAYQELYRVYGEDAPILGQIYQNLVRDWRNENVDIRGFATPIAVRNLANDIPDDVVAMLLDVCVQNVPTFQRYFALKAKWLGLEKLRRYDIYAPVVESNKKYDFNTGTQMVMEAFQKFHPDFAAMAQKLYDEDHLDSEVRKGKQDGAFCAPVSPDKTPWVLVNYQETANDVSTLAHELGHAIHGLIASDHSMFTYSSSLPLAETASTFAEMLLVDNMLEKETDEDVRLDILFRQVDDAYMTIIRQIFFALFERQAHDMIKNNASVDDLSAAYMENLQTQFGDAMEVGEEFKYEWVSIPHIYGVPFYVYAYSFGQLLVLSLYQQFKAEGESFKPRFMDILRAGGSASPTEVLSKAGVDISSAEFWQGGFDVIERLVTELEGIPVR